MSLLPTPTILESGTLAGAEAIHHAVTVLRSQWQRFWQRDPVEISTELHADLQKTLAIFSLNTQAGTAMNALLDSIADDRFPNRAPVELPPFWSFAGSGFVFTPPSPVTEEPQPE